MDPVTAVVTALSAGALLVCDEMGRAVARDVYDHKAKVGKAVHDAQEKLTRHLRGTYPALRIEALTEHPESELRQAVFKEDLEREGASADETARRLALALIRTIEAEVPPDRQRAVGIQIGTLEDAKATFREIVAGENATGAEIGRIVGGEATFDSIRAGEHSGEPYSKKS